ncbi:hypothetical protein MJO28_005568 [Puccinia striiformis f. sp. tritici]|uniref:Uncharacterized protein n=1 Tax=Puccinia striiformis f. sp. tritici TaxID=168172 RepID=A0ACC0EMY7_9BASI|nr:hypothetical protein MJO28_005568 [Puccinia striiformis f. sp. tritici]
MQVSPVVISGFFLLQGVLGNPLSPRGCVPKQSAAANSEVDVYPQIGEINLSPHPYLSCQLTESRNFQLSRWSIHKAKPVKSPHLVWPLVIYSLILGYLSKTAPFLLSRASYTIKTFDHKGRDAPSTDPFAPTNTNIQSPSRARRESGSNATVEQLQSSRHQPAWCSPNSNATTSSRLAKPTYVPSKRTWDKPEHLDRRAAAESSERYISVTWTPTHAWHCDHTKALLKAILDQQHKSKFDTATGDLQSQ